MFHSCISCCARQRSWKKPAFSKCQELFRHICSLVRFNRKEGDSWSYLLYGVSGLLMTYPRKRYFVKSVGQFRHHSSQLVCHGDRKLLYGASCWLAMRETQLYHWSCDQAAFYNWGENDNSWLDGTSYQYWVSPRHNRVEWGKCLDILWNPAADRLHSSQ